MVKWLWGQRGRYTSLDLRAPSKDGWQALHAAASGGQLEVVRWLVNRGAQISARPEPYNPTPSPNPNPNPDPNPNPNPNPIQARAYS